MLTGYIQLFGQESRQEICIGFRVGNWDLEPAYGDNDTQLSEAVSLLEFIKNDSTLDLLEVSFCGLASPEGSFAFNRELAAKRLASLEHYIREKISLPDSIVTRCDCVIAWERLSVLVEQSDMVGKDEVLNILRNIPEFTYDAKGKLTDSRKKRLMDLQYGRPWNYMQKHFFSRIRNASAVFITVREKQPVVKTPDIAIGINKSEPVVQIPTPYRLPSGIQVLSFHPGHATKPFYMGIKTNMLYDVLAVPNIGLEFYLGKNWSVAGNWMYGWWNKNGKHRYWRIYGGDIAIRRWFGKKADEKPLTGHHLGLYGSVFTYDFEWGGKGYIGGQPGGALWDEPNYAAGVEYGYSLPVARRLNIDFTVGLGYWGGIYHEYNPADGHYVWQSTKRRHWFGPTKAEISLVWLLGRGNSNDRKGGVR